MNIGFNKAKIEELIGQTEQGYRLFTNYVETEWASVQNALQTNWVGPDEQDFEKNFVERMNSLEEEVYELSLNTISNVVELGNGWIRFQRENTMSGGQSEYATVTEMDASNYTVAAPNPIAVKQVAFSDSTNFGLSSENSANIIKSAITEYVSSVREKANTVYSEIQGYTQQAFFGESQRNIINGYLQSVGTAMGVVITAVKDLYEYLDTYASKSYADFNEEVLEEVNTVTQTANDYTGIESRWT